MEDKKIKTPPPTDDDKQAIKEYIAQVKDLKDTVDKQNQYIKELREEFAKASQPSTGDTLEQDIKNLAEKYYK